MNIPSRKWVALAVCSAALGAGTVFALDPGLKALPPSNSPVAAQKPDPPAKDKDKPADEEWLPKFGDDLIRDKMKPPPTAFPELAIIDPDPKDPKYLEKREEQFAKLCPHFAGKATIKIEPTDDTLRKLLKARLHQGLAQMIRTWEVIRIGSWTAQFFADTYACLEDMETTCLELWSGQPKELIPWLEELVVMAKELARFHSRRVTGGTDPPQRFNASHRHRLRAEATLWKAKNPK